jgi:hypothetical protein
MIFKMQMWHLSPPTRDNLFSSFTENCEKIKKKALHATEPSCNSLSDKGEEKSFKKNIK